jgi:hypothetical protein
MDATKVRNPIQYITKILESSKSYIPKIYVSNISTYPRQTSIIVL